MHASVVAATPTVVASGSSSSAVQNQPSVVYVELPTDKERIQALINGSSKEERSVGGAKTIVNKKLG